jgi:hypothetical protein
MNTAARNPTDGCTGFHFLTQIRKLLNQSDKVKKELIARCKDYSYRGWWL